MTIEDRRVKLLGLREDLGWVRRSSEERDQPRFLIVAFGKLEEEEGSIALGIEIRIGAAKLQPGFRKDAVPRQLPGASLFEVVLEPALQVVADHEVGGSERQIPV